MRIGSYDLQMGEYEGYRLIAPMTFWMATDEERTAVCGGCGPGKFGDWFVPDTILGERITPACAVHDWCYSEGRTEEDKRIADILLWVNGIIIVDNGEALDGLRTYRMTTYYRAVRRCGGAAFGIKKTP